MNESPWPPPNPRTWEPIPVLSKKQSRAQNLSRDLWLLDWLSTGEQPRHQPPGKPGSTNDGRNALDQETKMESENPWPAPDKTKREWALPTEMARVELAHRFPMNPRYRLPHPTKARQQAPPPSPTSPAGP